jgi:hypothetical protein
VNVTTSSIGPSLAKRAAACLLAIPLLAVIGCASAPKAPAAAVLVELGPASLDAMSGGELRAAAGGRAIFADVSDAPQGSRLAIEREPGASGEAAAYVQRRLLIGDGEEKLIRVQSLALREDGAVVLVEEINHTEGVEVVFTPPLVVIPARIEAGEFPAVEGRMTVHPLGDRTRVRAKGPVKVAAASEGGFRVRTPAGDFDAWKLSSTLTAELGPSRVQNETVIWLVPGIGLIAEERREKTTVMGLPVRGNTEKWVLVELPAAAQPTGR